jgi:hypothetical protein
MAGKGKKERKAPAAPEVIRRKPEARKRLPAELEAFAAGDDDALWRRERRRGRMHDPRPVAAALVAGVANRDARLVYDARVKRLRAAIASGDEADLAQQIAEAVRLALWRGNAVVGFDVLAEAVLGIGAARGRELAARGAAMLGFPCEPGDERTIAMWMRAEAGLLEADPGARTTLRDGRLVLEVAFARAAEALSGAGRRATPLAREAAEEPEVVIDRPHGVEPLARIIARDRPTEE